MKTIPQKLNSRCLSLCFAVFTIKVTGHYIEATGQNEYAIKYQMVPLEP